MTVIHSDEISPPICGFPTFYAPVQLCWVGGHYVDAGYLRPASSELVSVTFRENRLAVQIYFQYVGQGWREKGSFWKWARFDIQYGIWFPSGGSNLFSVCRSEIKRGRFLSKMGAFRYSIWPLEPPSWIWFPCNLCLFTHSDMLV